MGFTEAVRTVLRDKYATFSGRASRSEYWWFALFNFIILSIFSAVIIGVITASGAGAFEGGLPSGVSAWMIIGGLYLLAIFLPGLAVQVRRFHDRNISGWWYLALFVLSMVPYLGFIAGIVILVISLLPGTIGPNRFGPDPLRPEVRAEVFA